MVYGYARISTAKQRLDRQIDAIKRFNPDAIIYQEAFTGTKLLGRVELDKLLKVVQPDDTIIFDSISRFSRNAQEGMDLYEELFNKGVNLVFLNERMCDTSVYRSQRDIQINVQIDSGNKTIDNYVKNSIKLINDLIIGLAKEQVRIAFERSEIEVQDLRERTSKALQAKVRRGESVGRKKDSTVETTKWKESKQTIIDCSKDFNGSNSDAQIMKLCGISRNTLVKYKRLIREEIIDGKLVLKRCEKNGKPT